MNNYLNDLFVLLIGTIVALNSISIPVSYQIVSVNLKQLLTRDSHLILINENTFRGNIIASLACLIYYAIPLFFNIFPSPPKVDAILNFFQVWYLIFAALFAIGFFLAFIRFSYRIYEYSSNAEDIMFEKSQQTADQFLDELE